MAMRKKMGAEKGESWGKGIKKLGFFMICGYGLNAGAKNIGEKLFC